MATTPRARFELERFAWGAPDRLLLSGRFTGLSDVSADAPVLVVHGPERTHRLQALPESLSGSLEDGSTWSAEFAWQEPPVAFDAATLELGPEIAVELPEPGAKRRWIRGSALRVRRPEREPEPQLDDSGPAPGAERVRMEAELLAAREEIRELRAAAEQAREELTRARDDLASERDRHAGDAERFREGLASVQQSAAEALARKQSAVEQLEAALRDARGALESKDAELDRLRAQLDDAMAARERAEADAEQLLSRLERIRDALADGR